MLRLDQLTGVMPKCAPVADRFLAPLDTAMTRFEINTPARQAAFLAQLAHESGELTRSEENLNYRWQRLRQIFPRYFRSDAEAHAYERQPERIANRAYANRNGNGDEASGDGWRYRGRGPIQLTGRANYRQCGAAIGVDIEADPDRVLDPVVGALTAAWFWSTKGLNALADLNTSQSFRDITKRVNGGFHGLEDRIGFWKRARSVLGLEVLEALRMRRRLKPKPAKKKTVEAKPAKTKAVRAKPAKAKPVKAKRAKATAVKARRAKRAGTKSRAGRGTPAKSRAKKALRRTAKKGAASGRKSAASRRAKAKSRARR